jgi:hypothetical protein
MNDDKLLDQLDVKEARDGDVGGSRPAVQVKQDGIGLVPTANKDPLIDAPKLDLLKGFNAIGGGDPCCLQDSAL